MEILELAVALKVVYEYGFELAEEHFIELTGEQYAALAREGEDASQRWFRISRGIFEERNNPPAEVPLVSEAEKARILRAVRLVYRMTAEEPFPDFRARLAALKGRLPPIFDDSPTSATESTSEEGVGEQSAGEQSAGEAPAAGGFVEPPREPSPMRGIDRTLAGIEALIDAGHIEDARDQLIEFILWNSRVELQLRAIDLLTRCPTHRTLHYLKHIYRGKHIETATEGRVTIYPDAPSPLCEAMRFVSAPQETHAHRVVRKAVDKVYEALAEKAAGEERKGLDDLMDVLRPPDSPIDSGPIDSDTWRDAEFRLGLDLPVDFKRLIATYGSGAFGSCLWLLNPFSGSPDLNLERRSHDLLARDHEHRRKFPGDMRFPLYPERDSLLPWGLTGGTHLYWLTEGPVDTWQTILFEARGSAYVRHCGTATDLLFRFINGAKLRILGHLPPDYRWTFQQPSESVRPPSGALIRLDLV